MSSDSTSSPACVMCGRPAQTAYRPFCSKRCADLDLGKWLKGSYAIPGPPEEADSEGPAPPQAPEEE